MSRPLEGIRVVVTRAEHQAQGLVAALEEVGARAELFPLLKVIPPKDLRPLERAAAELGLYDWLVFTSANAVEAFLPLTGGVLPPQLGVAVIGRATAAALGPYGVEPHLQAGESRAEGLVKALAPLINRRQRILLPQAADARPTLAQGLTRAGAEVVSVVAYDKGLPAEARARAQELFASQPLGWVTFTSPRIVEHFVELLGMDWEIRRPQLLAASIGPVTSRALRHWGVEPVAEAATPGDQEMVQAVVEAVTAGGASRRPR